MPHLFDVEQSHLLSLYLLREVQNNLQPVYSALDWSSPDTESRFVPRTWQKHLRSASTWKFSSKQSNVSSKKLYKACMMHYIRSVLNRPDQKAVPKLHHFMRKFFDRIISSNEMQSGDFFGKFGHADQMSCIQAAMRECLYDLMSHKPMAYSQISSIEEEDDVAAPSVGPDDSVSVASLSRLMPRKKKVEKTRRHSKDEQVKSFLVSQRGRNEKPPRVRGGQKPAKAADTRSYHNKSEHKSVHKSVHNSEHKSVHKSVHDSVHNSVHESIYSSAGKNEKQVVVQDNTETDTNDKASRHSRGVRSVTLSMESRSVR